MLAANAAPRVLIGGLGLGYADAKDVGTLPEPAGELPLRPGPSPAGSLDWGPFSVPDLHAVQQFPVFNPKTGAYTVLWLREIAVAGQAGSGNNGLVGDTGFRGYCGQDRRQTSCGVKQFLPDRTTRCLDR